MDIKFSLDALAAKDIIVPLRRGDNLVELRFSVITMEDMAEYSSHVRTAKLKSFKENIEFIKDDAIKIRTLDALALATIDEAVLMMMDIFGRTWAVNKCFLKANKEFKDEITKNLTPAEVNECFEQIALASGLTNPLKKEE